MEIPCEAAVSADRQGVLRLRKPLASPMTCFAQDDRVNESSTGSAMLFSDVPEPRPSLLGTATRVEKPRCEVEPRTERSYAPSLA